MQSVCVSKHEWHSAVGGHRGQWSEESFFPAIIKQFNWICSYAEELLVWISISMPSHKSYFQVHWALSSAKLILHDMPWGSGWRLQCRGHPDRHQHAGNGHTNILTPRFFFFFLQNGQDLWPSFLPYLSPVFKEVLPEHLLSGVLMVQHLGKEQCHLFSCRSQLHLLTCTQRKKQAHHLPIPNFRKVGTLRKT